MPSAREPSAQNPVLTAPGAARVLGNGRYTRLIADGVSGFARLGTLGLTGGSGDRLVEADGFRLAFRDRDTGAVWGAGAVVAEGAPGLGGAPGRITMARADRDIESRIEVCVVPDADAELHRLQLLNRSNRPRVIEVTTWAGVVLNEAAAYAAHPAFSNLFVQTEHVPDRRALLAHRRARARDERHPWLVHARLDAGEAEVETDRGRFLGRGGRQDRPMALTSPAPLSGTTGNVLDPIVSLRWTLALEPGGSAGCAYLLGAGAAREAALALADRFTEAREREAAFAGAQAQELRRRAEAGLDGAGAEAAQVLAAALLRGDPVLRAPTEVLARVQAPLSALERLGVAPHRPFAVVHADRPDAPAVLGDLLRAHRYWRSLGLEIDLVVVCGGKVPPELTAASAEIYAPIVLERAHASPAELDLLDAAACWAISSGVAEASARVRTARPIPAASPSRASRPPAPVPGVTPPATDPARPGDTLGFFNGTGGFSPAGDEYVIPLSGNVHRALPPRPWSNVITNERFGFIVSETGAGTTWSGNSREYRLTPWANDALLDPHGEAFFVRDEESGAFGSLFPGPAPWGRGYTVRHGFGYSVCRHRAEGVDFETTLFAPRADALRIAAVRLTNALDRPRRLSLFAYYRLVLGGLPARDGRFVVTSIDPASGALFAVNRTAEEFAGSVAYAAVAAPAGARAIHVTGDRESFVGAGGDLSAPRALLDAAPLDGRVGAGLDPCFAQQVVLDLPAGGTREVFLLLGNAPGEAAAREVLTRYAAAGAAAKALEEIRDFWRQGVARLQVSTPSPALDIMVNGWLPYQTLACRIWGRSAFYQSGGAFGFRDQLQDAASLTPIWPRLTREQILLHAAHQFVEGDVLHWWHPPRSKGIRTRFADDLVWLPYLTAHYVVVTGDESVLAERVRYLTARALAPGEDEAFLEPVDSGESGDVYEHCCRALDRAMTRGPHGLPLFGTGDWNDGMNRVGREGWGESVWMGFFLVAAIDDFLPFVERRGDAARRDRYRGYRDDVARAIESAAWDGDWYRRAYYDDGTPLGSRENDECRIDALVQAWAVLSGAAPAERANTAMDSVEAQLVSEKEGLIRLLTPPFDRTPHDPGYIKGYVPGVRENGGQYTHAALWVVRALAQLGRNDRAARLLDLLNPIHHARTPEEVAVYQVEPYVVAADVYGAPPHVGRGGWTWYTGSSGWMYRVAVESVLGFTPAGGDTLVIKPCVPDAWGEFTIRYRIPDEDTGYEITARNPHRDGLGVASATLDGAPAPVVDGAARIPIAHDGRLHRVEIVLGTGAAKLTSE